MIIILGKSGCQKCEAARQKMDLLNRDYTYVNMSNENWRNSELTDLVATALAQGIDPTEELPIFFIHKIACSYSQAMKILRGK